MYGDLPGIFMDRHNFEKIVERFGFKSDDYTALIEPKMKDCLSITKELSQLYRSNPHETILTLHCYSTHGMILDGRQIILVNEFNKEKGFFRFFAAE